MKLCEIICIMVFCRFRWVVLVLLVLCISYRVMKVFRVMKFMCVIDEQVISFFMLFCIRVIRLMQIIVINDSVIISQVYFCDVFGMIGRLKCRKLQLLIFRVMVVRIIELVVGVFMWVLGSQVWIGNIGILIVKVIRNVKKIQVCFLVDSGSVYRLVSWKLLFFMYRQISVISISIELRKVYRKNFSVVQMWCGLFQILMIRNIGISIVLKNMQNSIVFVVVKILIVMFFRIRKVVMYWFMCLLMVFQVLIRVSMLIRVVSRISVMVMLFMFRLQLILYVGIQVWVLMNCRLLMFVLQLFSSERFVMNVSIVMFSDVQWVVCVLWIVRIRVLLMIGSQMRILSRGQFDMFFYFVQVINVGNVLVCLVG